MARANPPMGDPDDPGPAAISELDEIYTLSPGAPLTNARKFMLGSFTRAGRRIIHHQGGAFYSWNGSHYPMSDLNDLRANLYQFLEKCRIPQENRSLGPFNPTRNKVSDIMDAMEAAANLPISFKAPCWFGEATDLPPDEIISCSNGLLHLPTGELLPPSPDFWCHNALDYDYNPKAPVPAAWLQFLDQVWGNDHESITALQEMFGYFLTGDTSLQKIFLMVGPKRSGKGTIARILTSIIGPENVCGPTLSGIGQNFGLAPLIGKRLAIISDARLGNSSDQHIIAERLLSISGEDGLTIDRKHISSWTGKLETRFVIMSNELPRLADASGALASRFITLMMCNSFYGREDRGLTPKLLANRPGILNWAIEGWRSLQERKHFVPPSSSDQAMQELEDLGSPVSAFVRDCCEVGAGKRVIIAHIFMHWRSWCERNGRDHPGTAQTFGRDLGAAVPGLKITQPREFNQARTYEGIRIIPGEYPD